MTDHKELNKNTYDFAVVGSNLHGLLVAYYLSRVFHKKVAIIEMNDFVGGDDADVTIGQQNLLSHFTRVINNEKSTVLLNWLQSLFRETIYNESVEITPLGVDSGKLIPFVGFGERKFNSMELLTAFTQANSYELEHSISYWVEKLEAMFIGDIYTTAEITKIETNEGQFKHAVINGSRNLQADHLVYCLPPKTLKKLVDNEIVAEKAFQKLMKTKTYSRVRLHLTHPADIQVEERPFHILFGNKDDYEPIIGQFHSTDENLQSLWSCWTLSELIDDHEHLGGVFKHIKKQIKRVYPDLLDNVLAEKIVIEIDSEGVQASETLLTKPFSKIDGFWVCHPQFIENTGFLAKISAAQHTINALQEVLGLKSEEIIIADEEESPSEFVHI